MKRVHFVLSTVVILMACLLTSCFTGSKKYGDIQGIVTDANTSEPLQGVNVSLSPTGRSYVTGSDGRFEFWYLNPGQYTVQAVRSGYTSNTKSVTIVEDNMASCDISLTPEVTDVKLSVEYLDFGINMKQLTFKIINNCVNTTLNWNITESMSWLTTDPSSGELPPGRNVEIVVDIDRSQIEQSISANLTININDQSIALPVNVSVTSNNGPQLQLSENALDFGVSASSLAFYVMNTGPSNTSLNWVCSNINVDWLTLDHISGSTAGGTSTQVIATIDRSLIDGNVSTSVSVSGAGSTSTITFSASSSGTATAILQLSEGSLDFGETETVKTFQVKNVGSNGSTLNWHINPPTVDWLTVTPMSGSTAAGSSASVTAAVDRTKINGPVSTTVIVIADNNTVNLNVSASHVDNTLVIADGLFCFFNFDGDEIEDYYGNYTGINAGAVASTDTPSGSGQSMQFNGENAFILVQDNIVPGGGPFTINLWYKTGRNDQFLVGSDDKFSISGDSKSAVGFTKNSNVCFYPYTYTQWTTGSISNYIDNRWHMLTLTYNGTIAMLFIDGTMLESKSSNELAWGTNVHNSFLGADSKDSGNYGFYNGKLDNFRSYNRALTPNEIKSLFNAKQ